MACGEDEVRIPRISSVVIPTSTTCWLRCQQNEDRQLITTRGRGFSFFLFFSNFHPNVFARFVSIMLRLLQRSLTIVYPHCCCSSIFIINDKTSLCSL